MKLTIDTRDHKRLVRDLDTFARSALPYAMRNGVNRAAFAGRKIWLSEMDRAFTLRNTWTKRQVRVDMAKGTKVATIQSVLGSLAPYQGERENSGRVQGSVPTARAGGQARGSKRTKLITSQNKLKNITLLKRPGKLSRKQRNAAAIRMARKAGIKFAHLDLGGKQGLFRIFGRKVDMIYNTARKSHAVKGRPTMHLTLQRVKPRLQEIYMGAIHQQLRRARVFGY